MSKVRRFCKPTKTMAAALRFVEISKEFLDDLLDNCILEKTKQAAKYGMKVFNGKFSGLVVVCFFFYTTKLRTLL